MKHLITGLLLIITCISTYAQLNSMGPFAPGKTTTKIIDSIAKAHNITVSETAELIDPGNITLSGRTQQVLKILHSCQHNNLVVYSYGNPIHDNHSLYQIDYLTVSNLLFTNVELHFWKDTLYYLRFDINGVNGDKFRNGVSRQYGDAIVERTTTKTKKIQCKNSSGEAFNEEEVAATTYYKTPKTISAWTTRSKYYNSECEAVYTDYFVLMNIAVDALVTEQEKKIEDGHRLSSQK